MLPLLLPLYLSACSDPPPPPPPPPPKVEKVEEVKEEPKEEAPTGPSVRLPEWGDGTMELRKGESSSDGSEREFLLGVSWIGPDLDGNLVQQWILFQGGKDSLPEERPDENIDGIMAYPPLVPSWEEGSQARPYAKIQPFIRCDTEDDRTLCRPCDGLAYDPTQARVCWRDLPSFQEGIWEALGKRTGLGAEAVRAIPHQVLTSRPYQHQPYSVEACLANAAGDTEYAPARNDRVLKDTKVIAFVQQARRGDERVLRSVVAKAEVGYPHRGGLLVQANGFAPMMRGKDQLPGPYAVNDWCEAVGGWCSQVSSGCELVEQVVVQGGYRPAAPAPAEAAPTPAEAAAAPAEGAPAPVDGAPAAPTPAEGAPAAAAGTPPTPE